MPPDEVRQAGREAKQEARAKVQEDKLDSDRRAIVFALNKFPKGETKSTIKDACGVGPPRFGRALASLIDDGTIVPVEISKGNNRKYEGYKVAEVPEK